VKPYHDQAGVTLYHGNAVDVLRDLPSKSVHCVVTSSPYWGLRRYSGVEPTVWRDEWLGCLGNEPAPDMFVSHLVTIFREVRRIMRDDATLWTNLGDSYSGSGRGPTGKNGIGDQGTRQGFTDPGASKGGPWNLKAKDLCLIPWRFAIAMQEDGWYVRSIVAWTKLSAMPESVEDRPTSAWEPIFLFTKSPRYFYDAQAVRQKSVSPIQPARPSPYSLAMQTGGKESQNLGGGNPNGTNLRNWWLLGPEQFGDAHYATFPSEIPRRAILAGTSEHGVCGAKIKKLRMKVNLSDSDRLKVEEFCKKKGLPIP